MCWPLYQAILVKHFQKLNSQIFVTLKGTDTFKSHCVVLSLYCPFSLFKAVGCLSTDQEHSGTPKPQGHVGTLGCCERFFVYRWTGWILSSPHILFDQKHCGLIQEQTNSWGPEALLKIRVTLALQRILVKRRKVDSFEFLMGWGKGPGEKATGNHHSERSLLQGSVGTTSPGAQGPALLWFPFPFQLSECILTRSASQYVCRRPLLLVPCVCPLNGW